MSNDYNYALEQAVYSTKANGFEELLRAGGVSLDGINISYNGTQYVFAALTADAVARLAREISQFFHDDKLEPLHVHYEKSEDLLAEAIKNSKATVETAVNNSECNDDDEYKQICIYAFELLRKKLSYKIHPSQKYIEIDFPRGKVDIYSEMFKRLAYKHMKISPEGKFVFDMQQHILEKTDSALNVVEDNSGATLFLNENILQAKPVYMVTKDVDEAHVSVQPFFQAPSNVAPACEFVLDVSKSMGKIDSESGLSKLALAKESLYQLAQTFFALYPHAPLRVQKFSSTFGLVDVGTGIYDSSQKEALREALSQVFPSGKTPLIETTSELVKSCVEGTDRGRNIIVFTDGVPTDANEEKLAALQRLIDCTKDGTEQMEIKLTTNKFSIISCGAEQPESLQEMCKQFGSQILNVSDAKFTAPSADRMAFLGQFLQFRDLLTCHTMITQTDVDSVSHQNRFPCYGSGQFVAAPAQICAKGAEVSFLVTDSLGNKVAETMVQLRETSDLSSSPCLSDVLPSTSQPSVGTSRVSFVGNTRIIHPALPVVGSTQSVSSSSCNNYTGPQ